MNWPAIGNGPFMVTAALTSVMLLLSANVINNMCMCKDASSCQCVLTVVILG
jgi:hypothetical protein